MEIVLVGLNHAVAPVAVRERLAFNQVQREEAQPLFSRRFAESVILSTCNRTEVYAVAESAEAGIAALTASLGEYHGLAPDAYVPYLYQHSGVEAARHLFAVAAGLDSLIVGEPQILGQVRAAQEEAAARRAVGPVLGRLFAQAVRAGKRVRGETAISRHAVSVSYAAVELARRISGGLAGRAALVVGAGKMGELAARTLVDCGLTEVVVANRTYAKTGELAARLGGRPAALEQLPQLLAEADVVICSTGAESFVIERALVADVMRKRAGRPLLFIDIAVPRDVDPAVRELADVSLYDIDDLRAVCTNNLAERRSEVTLAEGIVAEEVAAFAAWWESTAVLPTISALRQRAEEIRQAEVRKALAHIGPVSEEQRATIEAATAAIVKKILHQPTILLKAKSADREGGEYARVVRELFALEADRRPFGGRHAVPPAAGEVANG